MTISGAESPVTTSVVFIVAEPVLSVAVIWMTGAVFAALDGGVPDNVLVPPSSDSQLGALLSVYVKASEDVNVESENVKSNKLDILATGGTCELIGNVMIGTASAIAAHRSVMNKDRMHISKAFPPPHHRADCKTTWRYCDVVETQKQKTKRKQVTSV